MDFVDPLVCGAWSDRFSHLLAEDLDRLQHLFFLVVDCYREHVHGRLSHPGFAVLPLDRHNLPAKKGKVNGLEDSELTLFGVKSLTGFHLVSPDFILDGINYCVVEEFSPVRL